MPILPSPYDNSPLSRILKQLGAGESWHTAGKEISVSYTIYLLKTGCQWRMLPKEYPKWELVYYYYRKWRDDGTITEVHEVLRAQVRQQA